MSRIIKTAAFAVAAMGAAILAAPSAEAHGHRHGGWGHHHHHHHHGGWGHRHRHFHYGYGYRYRPVYAGYGPRCHWRQYVTVYGTIASYKVCHY